MKLTEEYVKKCDGGAIELKCNRMARLVDENGDGIPTYVMQGATIKAQSDVENRLYALLESDGEFRAYGYIDKDDYDGFDVLNPQINKFNMEHFNKLINALSVDDAKHLVRVIAPSLECENCPLREYCGIALRLGVKPCSEIVLDWLMENE